MRTNESPSQLTNSQKHSMKSASLVWRYLSQFTSERGRGFTSLKWTFLVMTAMRAGLR